MVRMIDMFPEDVRKKLDFFNKDKYTIATEEVDLKEKKKYGEVCLKCKLNKDTLIRDLLRLSKSRLLLRLI